MSIETTLTPINGKEAKDLIKLQISKILEQTPGLDFATSYHKLEIKGEIKLSAYPADTPVPKIELNFSLDAPLLGTEEIQNDLERIMILEAKREELLGLLVKLNETLDKVNPQTESTFELDAGSEPDNLRIQEGLPIPIVRKSGGRYIETTMEVKLGKDNKPSI